jgi:hypothetical protein
VPGTGVDEYNAADLPVTLRDQLVKNTGEQYCSDTVHCGLHRLGYVWKRPRYVLMPDPEREKKAPNSPHPVWLAKA